MMNKIKFRFFVLVGVIVILAMSSFVSVAHKYYVGLTEVNIDSKKHTLDVSTKLFMDDLEAGLLAFANKKVDGILEKLKDSKNLSPADIDDLTKELSLNIFEEMPIIFLYKPEFLIYNGSGVNIKLNKNVISPENKYDQIYKWYTQTEKVLKIFNQNKIINKIELLF